MDKDELKQRFVEMVKNGAMENFSRDKEVRPVLLVIKQDAKGDTGLVPIPLAPLMNPDGKDMVAKIIQTARMSSPAVALVTESWMVKKECKPGQKPEDINTDVPPSEDPDRIEVVNIMFYFGMESTMTSAEIIRPESGDPILANWKDYGDMPVRGRFGDPPPSWN